MLSSAAQWRGRGERRCSRERFASWDCSFAVGGQETKPGAFCVFLHVGCCTGAGRTQEAVVGMLVSGRIVSLSIGHAPLCAVVYPQRVRNIMQGNRRGGCCL